MKKARGMFAVAVILIVAGASGVLWYFHDSDKLGREKESEQNSVIWQNDGDDVAEDKRNDNNDGYDGNNSGKTDDPDAYIADSTTVHTSTDKNETDNTAVNEFLSIFSRVYFAENQPYSSSDRSSYELIRFAYSHLRRMNPSVVVMKEENDAVRYYNGVPIEEVNKVLGEFLGVKVKQESVYTENDYMFFKFENGVFYTPATDGVGYTNLAVADTVEADGDMIKVDFTIYSDGVDCNMTSETAEKTGERYKSGKAVLRVGDNGYILESYSVK